MRKTCALLSVLVLFLCLPSASVEASPAWRGPQLQMQGTTGPGLIPLFGMDDIDEVPVGYPTFSLMVRYLGETVGDAQQHQASGQMGAWLRVKEYAWFAVESGVARDWGVLERSTSIPVSFWTRLRFWEGRLNSLSESAVYLPVDDGEIRYYGFYRLDYVGCLPTPGDIARAKPIVEKERDISERELVRRIRPFSANVGFHAEQRGLEMTFGPHVGVGCPEGGCRIELQYHLGYEDGWNHAFRLLLLLGRF